MVTEKSIRQCPVFLFCLGGGTFGDDAAKRGRLDEEATRFVRRSDPAALDLPPHAALSERPSCRCKQQQWRQASTWFLIWFIELDSTLLSSSWLLLRLSPRLSFPFNLRYSCSIPPFQHWTRV